MALFLIVDIYITLGIYEMEYVNAPYQITTKSLIVKSRIKPL